MECRRQDMRWWALKKDRVLRASLVAVLLMVSHLASSVPALSQSGGSDPYPAQAQGPRAPQPTRLPTVAPDETRPVEHEESRPDVGVLQLGHPATGRAIPAGPRFLSAAVHDPGQGQGHGQFAGPRGAIEKI